MPTDIPVMPATTPIDTRWADAGDLPFLRSALDGRLSDSTLLRKIDGAEIIVASLGDEPIGCLLIDLLWSTLPFIATVRVVEGYRARGAGRAMLSLLEERARANGATRILSSSQCDEPEAQAWHRRMGFVECGVIAGHNDGIGEIFFRKGVGDQGSKVGEERGG